MVHILSHEIVKVPVSHNGEVYEEDQIHLRLRPIRRKQCRCPVCQSKCPGYDYKSDTESMWRAANLNGVPVFLFYRRQRVKCSVHGVLSEYLPWEDGDSHFTESFNNEAAWLALQMSKTAVATFLQINWRTVGNCIRTAHNRIEPDVRVRLNGVRRICVDETSYQKGHKYITVVYDMDKNQVIWVHVNHGKEIFAKFCELLSEEQRSQIEIVAGDGAQWIDTCTRQYFPNAVRCVDFFHVVQWANEALDKVRTSTASKATREYNRQKDIFRKAEEELSRRRREAEIELAGMPKRGRPSNRRRELEAFLKGLEEIETSGAKPGRPRKEQFTPEHQAELDALLEKAKEIKGSKYALGHRPDKCTQGQVEKLQLIQNSFPDLYTAYQLKESLRLILHMKDADLAAEELLHWIDNAKTCGLAAMEKLGEKIENHQKNILHAVQYQANSSKSEAVNTTIKALIRMGRGFRNINNLIALVYLKCSDLVIPLNNRYQPSAELLNFLRLQAALKRQRREEARKNPEVS